MPRKFTGFDKEDLHKFTQIILRTLREKEFAFKVVVSGYVYDVYKWNHPEFPGTTQKGTIGFSIINEQLIVAYLASGHEPTEEEVKKFISEDPQIPRKS